MRKIWKAKNAKGESILQKFLSARNLNSAEEISEFLDPKYENSPDPFLLKDMEAAAARKKLRFMPTTMPMRLLPPRRFCVFFSA